MKSDYKKYSIMDWRRMKKKRKIIVDALLKTIGPDNVNT